MKKIFIIILLLNNFLLRAADNKGSIVASIQITRYLTENQRSGNQFLPFCPGGEIFYQYSLNDKWAVIPGINYSYSEFNKEAGSSYWKTKAQELAFPILLERNFAGKLCLSFGFYPGWLLKGEALNKNKFSNNKWLDVRDQFDYEESKKFTCDLYLDLKYRLGDQFNAILPGPFIKYKLIDNWMEHRRKPFSFGMNLGFAFGL